MQPVPRLFQSLPRRALEGGDGLEALASTGASPVNIRHVTLRVGTRSAVGKKSAYALILREGRRRVHGRSIVDELTPNALVLTAILAGIRKLKASPTTLEVRTGSHYAAVVCAPLLDRWRAADWTRPANVPGEMDPVAHAELWDAIVLAAEARDIRLSWTWTGSFTESQKNLLDREMEIEARRILAEALGDAAPPALLAEVETRKPAVSTRRNRPKLISP